MLVSTTQGVMDDSRLQKRVTKIDNENELTTAIEYCVLGCIGPAHNSEKPDSDSHFCSRHVHRSVHVTLKKFVGGLGVAAPID